MSNNSFKVKNSLTLTPVDLSQVVNPQAGDLACDINDSNKIKRYDANSAAWTEVGSGGVGGTDILFVQDFESASLSSFTQTGLSLSQTDPLHGKVSALLTHQNAVNQSFKQVIAVDRKFRGEAMTMRLNVKSNASAGNVTINIYDETNAANLVASEQLQLANDTSGALNKIAFTIPETCASLSYTVTALPEAGSPVTRVDDIIAELAVTSLLETSVEVPNITAWQGYTPTFQGFGTPSAIEFEWRQVGEDVEIRGKFTGGTVTAVEARVGLPGGLTSSGTDKIPSIQSCGIGARGENGVAGTYQVLIEPNVSYVTFALGSSVTSGYAKVNGSNLVNAGASFGFFAKVPCAGLSATTTKTIDLTQSGLVQEADSMVRVYGPNGAGSTGTRVLRFATLATSLGSDITYTDSATNGGSFTVNTSGIYSVSGWYGTAQSLTLASVGITINTSGAELSTNVSSLPDNKLLSFSRDTVNSASTSTKVMEVSWTGYLNAGDVLRLQNDGESNGGSHFTVAKQGSLKQVTVSSDQKIKIPTSELRMEGASSRGAVAQAIVRFDTVAKLRGDAFTVTSNANDGTFITMTKAGKLDIATSIYKTAGDFLVALTRNQTTLNNSIVPASELLNRSSNSSTGNIQQAVSWSGFVNVGDIIRVSASAAPTSDANIPNSLNLSFQEQEVAVSVTNTLPQFSESDSSVRVDTANGYGSTGNKIRRFSNIRDNIGTDIEYVDSATNGASFTAKSSGLYDISYTDEFTGATTLGITKNASSLSTNLGSLPASEILKISSTGGANFVETVSCQAYLNAGDVIRAHTNGTASGTGPSFASFIISKVGKPNVTGVDVTPFVKIPQNDVETTYYVNVGSFAGGATITGALTSSTNKGILSYNSSTGVYTALKRCTVNASMSARSAAAATTAAQIVKNASTVIARSNSPALASYFATAAGEFTLEVGESFFCNLPDGGASGGVYISVAATAASDSIITANESFSTDTALLQYASSAQYTLSTLANAPVGTFITFIKGASNALTQTTTAPTQTTSDMAVNGILTMLGTTAVSTTAGAPGAFAMQIGKGLKGVSLQVFKSAAKTTAGILDGVSGIGNTAQGVPFSYNEKTGVLYWSTCSSSTSTITAWYIPFEDNTFIQHGTQAYLVINASKSPALAGVPLLKSTIFARAVNTAGTSIGPSTPTDLTYNVETFDSHSALDVSTGIFTAPESGYYQYNGAVASAFSSVWAADDYIQIRAFVNGVSVSSYITYIPMARTMVLAANLSDIIYLNKNDQIKLVVEHGRSASINLDTSNSNYFSIQKII